MERIQPAIGLAVMIALLYVFSANRRAIQWRVVYWGMALQILFALFVLRTSIGEKSLTAVNNAFVKVIDAADKGAEFVFGPLGNAETLPVGVIDKDGEVKQSGQLVVKYGRIFAFRVLPTIILFS